MALVLSDNYRSDGVTGLPSKIDVLVIVGFETVLVTLHYLHRNDGDATVVKRAGKTLSLQQRS